MPDLPAAPSKRREEGEKVTMADRRTGGETKAGASGLVRANSL